MRLKMLLFASVSLILLAACQEMETPYMTLESNSVEVPAEGGTFVIELASNVYYRVNNDCSIEGTDSYWAVIESTTAQGDVTQFTVKVSPNSSTNPRSNTIRFIGDGVTPLKFTINQKKETPKGITPTTESVVATATEASFSVFCEGAWTATCADSDVVINPTSGVGECDVNVSFPENGQFVKRTITITVNIQGDKDYTYTLEQAGYKGILADWDLKPSTDATTITFSDDGQQTTFPSNNGKFVAPSTGNGRIEYFAAERTGYIQKNAVCTRAVGSNGDPYVSGAIPGDYWYIYGSKEGAVIPAGTNVHFYFVTKLGTMCSTYWMIEYKDGDEWKPALPTSTTTESATVTMSGASIEYSATITYNFAGTLLDTSNNGAYIPAEGTFTTTKDMDEIVVRFGQAGHLGLNGAKYSGQYIDWTHTSGQTRFSAQHPSNPETGVAVKEYTQHVLLEIVE